MCNNYLRGDHHSRVSKPDEYATTVHCVLHRTPRLFSVPLFLPQVRWDRATILTGSHLGFIYTEYILGMIYLGGGGRPRVPPSRYIWNQDGRWSLLKFFLRQKRDWVNNQSTRKHRTPRVIQKSKLLTSLPERSQVLTATVSDYYIFSEDGIYMYSRVPI